ncbi:MAG: hypothetical protein HY816_02830 [Candidatus Wallbacteria bacterium]|nr:hypothetical protein [Candidatus Wallbacteria bacterium]
MTPRRPRGNRFFLSGFTLVDLILTLLLLVTLAGVSSFYFEEFRDTQRTALASNELDSFVKAVQAYELTTGTPIDDAFVNRYTQKGFPPLQFLVDLGNLQQVNPDPWGRDYQVDTARGFLYSLGPKDLAEDPDGADDIRKPYKKELSGSVSQVASPLRGGCDNDREAPVVSAVEPVGTVDLANPAIRCTFFDNVGGSVAVDRSKLFVDGVSVGEPALVRSSNQMVYTTPGGLAEGEHTVVAQVEDGCGNISRRQWKFTIDISRLTVQFLQPNQAQVRKSFPISAIIYNQGRDIGRWTLLFDSRVLASGETESKSPLEEIILFPNFDTVAQGTADGRHTLTLSVSKPTGHTEETRKSLDVDNTAPVLLSILNKTTPGATCLQAQRVTTTVPDLGGVARDNFVVSHATYQYFSVDQATGTTIAALTPLTTALPFDWSPDTNPAHQTNDPAALFGQVEETFYTKPHGSASAYKPATLPEGLYQVVFQARDLAGNVSVLDSKATTCFFVDLQKGGIKDQKFLDATSARCGLGYSEDQRHIRGSLAISSAIASSETSGRIEFTMLDAGTAPCPICTWEVVIDDNGPLGRPDGTFSPSAPFKDWVTGASYLNQAAGQVYRTALYEPDAALESLRRSPGGTSPVAVQEGPLRTRINYISPSGTAYTTYTTFFIDNSVPIGAGQNAFVARQAGTVVPIRENDILFSVSSGTDPNLGQIEFGGIFQDMPVNGVIRQASWSLTKGPSNSQVPVVNTASIFPYAGSPCTTHTASFGVAAGLSPASAGAMLLSTTVTGGLDGEYRLTLSITDGAGLTTAPVRQFKIDTLPPEVKSIQIWGPEGKTADPLDTVNCATGASKLTTIEGPALRFSPVVDDQFAVREVHYWLVPVTIPPTAKSAPIVIPITGVSTFPNIDVQVVTRDTKGATLKPLPQTYELQVEAVGVNRPNPGPLCRTSFSFKFLSNLAVFAPLDAASVDVQSLSPATIAASRTWLTSQEQGDAAGYLVSAFGAATNQLFDFRGRNGRAGFDPLIKLTDWLSQNAANGTTDILVLFDSVPAEAVTASPGVTPPLRAFLEGGSGAARPEGNVVVYVGPVPFVRQIDPISAAISPGPAQSVIFGADLGIDTANTNGTQLHNPAGLPIPFLPSLYEYTPFTDFVAAGAGFQDVWLRSGPHAVGGGAGDWVLEKLFTVEQSQTRGNNFVYRHKKSQGIFASFYGIGASSLAQNRSPVTPMPYVIEEFLKSYVTGGRNPALATKRIAFNNADPSYPAGTVAPSATAFPKDIFAYPSASGGYTNLTTNGSGGTDAVLVDLSDDGRTVTLLARDRSKEGGAGLNAPAQSLFGLDDQTMRSLALARDGGGPMVSGSRARRGGAAAAATRSDLKGVNGGFDLDHTAVFLIDGTSGAATQLTSGGILFGDAASPSLSPEGQDVVFASPNVYDTIDGALPAAFTRLKTLASGGIGIFRYNARAAGTAVYQDGWVSRSLGESPVCARPRIAGDGIFVAFQARNVTYKSVLTATDQVYLAVAQPGNTPAWAIGAITQAGAVASGNVDIAESATGGGSFPPIVFESSGDFRGQRPNGLPISSPTDSTGASAAGDLGFKAIWYFTGDFSAELIPIARGLDADCKNPRLSPDGTEVVFESAATQLVGPVSLGGGVTHTVRSTGTKNRIYRARVRIANALGGTPSVILERISPETVDVGAAGLPAISR